jgi:hypothetical protein
MSATTKIARVVAAIGGLALAGVTLVYVASLAGLVFPSGALLMFALPALFVTGAGYIILARRTETDEAPGFRWWMPVVWVALIVNDGVVWSLADRVTAGGQVEQANGRTALVVHGRIVRELDPSGVREVALWDTRQISSHLLVALAFAYLGVVALLPPRAEVRAAEAAP